MSNARPSPDPARPGALALRVPDRHEVSESWAPVLEAWLDVRADSPNTRRAYRHAVVVAMGAIGVRHLRELSGAMLTHHRGRVVAGTWALATKRLHLSALRSFLLWAAETGASPIPEKAVGMALPIPRGQSSPPRDVLTDQELGRLLAAATSARDGALLALLSCVGLRRAEAVALDCSDLREDPQGGPVLQVRGKGGRDRQVPVPPRAAQLIRAYLAEAGLTPASPGPLLLHSGRRLSGSMVGHLVAELVGRAGISKSISPHNLRHTAAVRMLERSGDLYATQQVLGHVRAETTAGYLRQVGLPHIRSAMADLPKAPASPSGIRRTAGRT